MRDSIVWVLRPGHSPDELGLIPSFIYPDDERSVVEQIRERYIGGWDSFKGFTLNPKSLALSYPGDPALQPIAFARVRNEIVVVYESAWTIVVQPDGEFEAARLD